VNKLYGISRINPIEFIKFLTPVVRKEKCSLSISQPNAQAKTRFLLFLTAEDLVLQLNFLRTLDSIGIVFDCMLRLQEITGIDILDDDPTVGIDDMLATIIKGLQVKTHTAISLTKNDVITDLLNTKKTTGFLHSYNTLLYKVSNKDVRERLRGFIIGRMSGKLTQAAFGKNVELLLPSRGKARDAVIELAHLVNAEEGSKLRTALIETRAKGADFEEEVAAAHKVELFDLRYFLSTIAKAKVNENADKKQKPSTGEKREKPKR